MPSFIKPFAAVTGRNSYSLFDIRYVRGPWPVVR